MQSDEKQSKRQHQVEEEIKWLEQIAKKTKAT